MGTASTHSPTSSVQLGNGLSLRVRRLGTVPLVTLSVGIWAGSRDDPDALGGTAFLLGRVLDRATVTRPAEALAAFLDDRGLVVEVHTVPGATSVTCTVRASDFADVLEVMSDMVRTPALPDDQVATRRLEVLTTLGQLDDDPAHRAVESLRALVYAGHPDGRPLRGRRESVERITREDLLAFHAAHFGPARAAVAVAGDVDADAVAEAVDRSLGRWASGSTCGRASAPRPVPRPGTRRLTVSSMMGKAQADIAYGFPSVRRTDPRYDALLVLNCLLGEYGLGGRIGERIREREGLAYYAFSHLDASEVEGLLLVRAGVDGAHVERAIADIDEEITRVAAEGPTEAEVADARRSLAGAIPRRLETTAGVAGFLLECERYGLPVDHDRELPGRLLRVSRDEVVARARELLDAGRATIAVAGPYPAPRSERET